MKPDTLAEYVDLTVVIDFLRFAKVRLNPDEYKKLFEIYRQYSVGGIE